MHRHRYWRAESFNDDHEQLRLLQSGAMPQTGRSVRIEIEHVLLPEELQKLKAAVAAFDARYGERPLYIQDPGISFGAQKRIMDVVKAARSLLETATPKDLDPMTIHTDGDDTVSNAPRKPAHGGYPGDPRVKRTQIPEGTTVTIPTIDAITVLQMLSRASFSEPPSAEERAAIERLETKMSS